MTNYLMLTKLSLKSQLVYASDFLSHTAVSILYYLFLFIFITSIFTFTANIAGWSENEMKYIFYLSALITLLTEIFAQSVYEFFNQVSEGTVEPFLVMPIRKTHLLFFRWCEPANIGTAILLFSIILISDNSHLFLGWVNFSLFILSVIAAVLINIFFVSTISFMTFITKRKIPVDYIYEEAYRLTILPASLFPQNAFPFLLILLPIVISASAPAAIIVKNDLHLLIYLTGALVFTFLFFCFSYRFLLGKFDFLGG
jgi:ABC-type uncharacterized transport system permease subunit